MGIGERVRRTRTGGGARSLLPGELMGAEWFLPTILTSIDLPRWFLGRSVEVRSGSELCRHLLGLSESSSCLLLLLVL
jgi:hypothetical protein